MINLLEGLGLKPVEAFFVQCIKFTKLRISQPGFNILIYILTDFKNATPLLSCYSGNCCKIDQPATDY